MNQDHNIYGIEGDDNLQPPGGHAHASSPDHDATRRYAIRCTRCGYTLNGLTVGSFCPECGHQVGLGGGMDAQTSGYAVASLVLGILSLISCWFYGIPAFVLGPLAIWFASKAKAQVLSGQAAPSSLGLATAGKVTGIIGLSLAAIVVVLIVLFVFLGFSMAYFP